MKCCSKLKVKTFFYTRKSKNPIISWEPSASSTAPQWNKKTMESCTYLSMWMKQELFLCFMVGHPGRASRGIVSLLRLRSRMSETMGHFSSKPLTTKYRQDTQETSILPKAPLFALPRLPAFPWPLTVYLFKSGWILLPAHSFSQNWTVT